MKTVWKWKLSLEKNTIDMPTGAQVLTIQEQYENVALWALVNPEEKTTCKRTFCVYGTGHDMPDNPGHYIGTVQLPYDFHIVLHVFEEK